MKQSTAFCCSHVQRSSNILTVKSMGCKYAPGEKERIALFLRFFFFFLQVKINLSSELAGMKSSVPAAAATQKSTGVFGVVWPATYN